MAKIKKPINPFYVILVPVGIAFVATACSFGLMAYNETRPGALPFDEQNSLMQLMSNSGMWILGIEVVLVGLLSFAAMATEQYWENRAELNQELDNPPNPTDQGDENRSPQAKTTQESKS